MRALFDCAVARAFPAAVLPEHLPPPPRGRTIVVGAGKASAAMALALERTWPHDASLSGLVITRYGHIPAGMLERGSAIEIVEARHPVPDAAGQAASGRMLDLLQGLRPEDLVIALISGGASALLVAPAAPVTLADKQAVNAALLASGAPISAINRVRKHLSGIKGGRLAAAAWPARVLALLISDVPGDDPALIGSGPTVGEDSTPAEALAILERVIEEIPPTIRSILAGGSSVVRSDDPRLARVENRVIAAPAQSLAAAAALARSFGFASQVLGDDLEGEAREIARTHADMALRVQAGMRADDPPLVVLSGGELTVTRRGDGVGGPNAEYCLALALALNGARDIHALAADTDGVDGAAEIAGAVIGPDTLQRAAAMNVDPWLALARNDAHTFFAAIAAGVVTGPTLTNVNDFRAILIRPRTM